LQFRTWVAANHHFAWLRLSTTATATTPTALAARTVGNVDMWTICEVMTDFGFLISGQNCADCKSEPLPLLFYFTFFSAFVGVVP
jgi:hypothetical protein